LKVLNIFNILSLLSVVLLYGYLLEYDGHNSEADCSPYEENATPRDKALESFDGNRV